MADTKKSNTIILTVIAILTLLFMIVGATFAYFSATIKYNNQEKTIIIKTSQVGTIIYDNTDELRLMNAKPGDSKEITFRVSSSSDSIDLPYSLNWSNVTNDFANPSDLIYSLKGTKNGGGRLVNEQIDVMVPTSNKMIGTGLLKPGETHEYTLRVTFKETGVVQDENSEKSFVGQITVSTNN